MSDVKWVRTDKHVYGAIYREHNKELTTFASFSNPTPSYIQHKCEMLTEWGFKGADYPLIKAVTRWDHENRDATEEHAYYIAAPVKDTE